MVRNRKGKIVLERHLESDRLSAAQRTISIRVYYTLAVWRFKPILSAGLRLHSKKCGGLRLRNYRTVAENYNFITRLSAFAYLGRFFRHMCGRFIFLEASP